MNRSRFPIVRGCSAFSSAVERRSDRVTRGHPDRSPGIRRWRTREARSLQLDDFSFKACNKTTLLISIWTEFGLYPDSRSK